MKYAVEYPLRLLVCNTVCTIALAGGLTFPLFYTFDSSSLFLYALLLPVVRAPEP
jgi:hypothetical protein